MAGKKKRAPGGGRKPQGEFERLDSPFSVRMPKDLRVQLEAVIKGSNRSLSQEVLRRLNDSFGVSRDRGRDQATRAICFLIAELADKLRWNVRPGEAWFTNPFLFRAFKIAVEMLLQKLEPKGKLQPPASSKVAQVLKKSARGKPLEEQEIHRADLLLKIWKSPSSAGNYAGDQVLSDLFLGAWHPDDVAELFAPIPDIADEAARSAERTWYGMKDARNDLQLKAIPDFEWSQLKKGGVPLFKSKVLKRGR